MQIIAHRGANLEQPANTLAAFERALEIGVDALEADLLLTRDGQIVVCHDDYLQIEGQWQRVCDLTCDDLKHVDLGKGQAIPTLEQFLGRFEGRSKLMLDLKAFGLARPLADVLNKKKGLDVHVTSFLHQEIVEIKQLCPEVERSIVLASMPIRFQTLFEDTHTNEVSLFRSYLNSEIVRRLVDHGILVRAYPVNHYKEAVSLSEWGVHAIFTDDPLKMQGLRDAS
jgi:glycerophosphoryl diester phosphodiesterase